MDTTATPESAPPRPGRELGGYVLGARLGTGGMGVVYRAVDADGNDVALKLLHPHIAADPEARSRLRREVATLQRIRGVGVSRVLDAETELEDAFVVTELIDGVTLDESVRRDGVFAGQELADFTDDMYRALSAIHAAGVVHRDLKPSNVMVTDNGPVLIDFGIAHAADESRITQTGMVMGTPGYLAPEVLSGASSSPLSDWWAHAAVLLFAATGRPAFGRGPLDVILGRVTSGACDVDGLEPRLAGIFQRALATEPSARTEPAQFLATIEAYAASLDDPAPAAGETPSPGDSAGERRTRLQRVIPLGSVASEAGATAVPGTDLDDWEETTAIPGEGKLAIGVDIGPQTRAFEVSATELLDASSSWVDPSEAEPRPPMITPGVAPEVIAAPSRQRGVDIGHLPKSLHPGAAVGSGVPRVPTPQPGVPQPDVPVDPQPSAPVAWPSPGSWPSAVAAPAPAVMPTASGLIWAVAGLTVGLGVIYPSLAFGLLAIVVLVAQAARLAGRAGDRMWSEKGRRPASIRLAMGWPWYLLRSMVSTLVSWSFAVVAGLLVMAGVELVVAITMDGVVANFGSTAERWPLYARCGAAAGQGVACLVVWLGPFGARQREGVARIARATMPTAVVRKVVSLVLIGVAVVLIAMAIMWSGIPNWVPFILSL